MVKLSVKSKEMIMQKRKTNWYHFWLGILPSIILSAMLVWSISYLQEKLHRFNIDNAPTTEYFEYKKTEFVRVDGKSLVFKSTSKIKQSYPMLWNDILRCKDGSEYRFTSVQNATATSPTVKTTFKTTNWDYNEPFPLGKTCYLKSTIMMDVEGVLKRQIIQTEDFVIN